MYALWVEAGLYTSKPALKEGGGGGGGGGEMPIHIQCWEMLLKKLYTLHRGQIGNRTWHSHIFPSKQNFAQLLYRRA